jgi:hypothetical protein
LEYELKSENLIDSGQALEAHWLSYSTESAWRANSAFAGQRLHDYDGRRDLH